MAPGSEPRDPFQPVDFAPVRIGARRRTLDPLVVGGMVLAFALVVAIVKPWGRDAGSTIASVVPVPTATSAPTTIAAAGGRWVGVDEPMTAVSLLAALESHDAWGVRFLVEGPAVAGRLEFAERWFASTPDAAGAPPIRFATETPIKALGVTAPSGETPLAVRVWTAADDGEWHWLDARRPASDRPGADLLLTPPRVDGVVLAAWPAGDYRLDLLMGTSIERLAVTIQASGLGGSVVPSKMPDVPEVRTSSLGAWLGNVPTGAYAVADGVMHPLIGMPGALLDEAGSWLDLERRVASTAISTATGLGVLLPTGAHDASGIIRRLAPGGDFEEPLSTKGIRFDAYGDPTPFIQFANPAGRAWTAGVYAIEMAWDGSDGHQVGTWHVELMPGDAAHTSSMLDAARRYAAHAGSDEVVLSGAGRRQPDPAAAPVRALPLADAIGCDERLIDETPAVLGFALPIGDTLAGISATLDGAGGRSLDVRLRVARDVLPGLSLVAPARGAAFSAGIYHLVLSTGAGPRDLTLCLGTSPFSG